MVAVGSAKIHVRRATIAIYIGQPLDSVVAVKPT
jgi:hypothetical protein